MLQTINLGKLHEQSADFVNGLRLCRFFGHN
ncbi:MAG: hypothetical protein HLUCCA11_24530, partial [Phormidesmis priestleyi Ana]